MMKTEYFFSHFTIFCVSYFYTVNFLSSSSLAAALFIVCVCVLVLWRRLSSGEVYRPPLTRSFSDSTPLVTQRMNTIYTGVWIKLCSKYGKYHLCHRQDQNFCWVLGDPWTLQCMTWGSCSYDVRVLLKIRMLLTDFE